MNIGLNGNLVCSEANKYLSMIHHFIYKKITITGFPVGDIVQRASNVASVCNS